VLRAAAISAVLLFYILVFVIIIVWFHDADSLSPEWPKFSFTALRPTRTINGVR